jgi:hypothetical protein
MSDFREIVYYFRTFSSKTKFKVDLKLVATDSK